MITHCAPSVYAGGALCYVEGMHMKQLNEEEARAMRDDMLAGALPVVFAGPLAVGHDGSYTLLPFVQLDAAGRPDVADVFRVIHTEGMQARSAKPCRYVDYEGRGYRESTMELTDPVSVSFKFVLTWPEHRGVFDLMLQEQCLMITTKSVETHLDATDVIGERLTPEDPIVFEHWRALLSEGEHR
jgi:hypothetical protein